MLRSEFALAVPVFEVRHPSDPASFMIWLCSPVLILLAQVMHTAHRCHVRVLLHGCCCQCMQAVDLDYASPASHALSMRLYAAGLEMQTKTESVLKKGNPENTRKRILEVLDAVEPALEVSPCVGSFHFWLAEDDSGNAPEVDCLHLWARGAARDGTQHDGSVSFFPCLTCVLAFSVPDLAVLRWHSQGAAAHNPQGAHAPGARAGSEQGHDNDRAPDRVWVCPRADGCGAICRACGRREGEHACLFSLN
jgi:hypothetical protein